MLMLVTCQHHPSRMYNQIWADAHVELNRLLKEEMPEEPREPEKDRVVFFQRVAVLYMRYLRLFRQLEKAYDQVVHPQKRRAIRPVLDAVMGRVLELKYDMVETEFSEYHYLDDVLHDMKLMPVSVKLESKEFVGRGDDLGALAAVLQADLEIPIPHYFISERCKEAQERNAMLTEMLTKVKAGRSKEVNSHDLQDKGLRFVVSIFTLLK